MDYSHKVLHHLLLGRKSFLVEHQHFTVIKPRIMLKPLKPKAGQTVFMSKYQGPDLSCPYVVHKSKKLLTVEIQTTAHFLNKFDIGHTFCHTKIFKYPTLILKVRLLRRTGDSTIRSEERRVGKECRSLSS